MTKSLTTTPPSEPRKPRPLRGRSRYNVTETRRLVKGVLDAGMKVTGIEVDPVTGALRILAGQPDAPVRDTPEKVLKNL